jgi:cell division septum initiation protein DivIVA
VIGVVDGIRDAYEALQTSHHELAGQVEALKGDLQRNQTETH